MEVGKADGKEPLIFTMRDMVEQITQDDEFKKTIGMFVADLILSTEYQSKHGRAHKTFVGMQDSAQIFNTMNLPNELEITSAEVDSLGMPGKHAEVMKSWFCSSTASNMWGMSPNKFYIGLRQSRLKQRSRVS